MKPFAVTTEELRWYHSMDRELFRRLVVSMGCDPLQIMKIIALFMWLEAIGYPNIIDVLRTFPDVVLYAFVEEALICLYFIESDVVPQLIHKNIHLMLNLMRREFSVQYLYENRERGRTVISKTVHGVLMRTFDDILQEAMATADSTTSSCRNENLKLETTVEGHILIMENGEIKDVIMPHHAGSGGGVEHYHTEMLLPSGSIREDGFQAPNVNDGQYSYYMGESSNQAAANRVVLFDGVAAANRTLFLTFQIGHAITVQKLRDFFFANNCGHAIEVILMDESTNPDAQFMTARVVLHSAEDVARVLNGNPVAGIIIDGKNVLVRGG